LQHVGLIEPLVVFPAAEDQYWLLDGHLRLEILKARDVLEVRCLMATDDEAYTYNKRVNFLPAIAEHYMILKAITNGVSEETIAAALDVDVADIRKRRSLLDGICPEASELLKDKHISRTAVGVLRKMKSSRQIQAAELMIAANNYTLHYAKALLMATKPDLWASAPELEEPSTTPGSQKTAPAISPMQRAIIDEETEVLLQDIKAARDSYGSEILNLTVSCRYVETLLANGQIKKFLTKRHPEMLEELRQLLAAVGGDRPKRASAASGTVRKKKSA
jgi:ParB-like chromosome segregation protein Spo0J